MDKNLVYFKNSKVGVPLKTVMEQIFKTLTDEEYELLTSAFEEAEKKVNHDRMDKI